MEILIGLILALGLLWAWLAGHWFGRVAAFVAFGVLFSLLSLAFAEHTQPIGSLIGIALAWPVASLPTYHYRGWRFFKASTDCRDVA